MIIILSVDSRFTKFMAEDENVIYELAEPIEVAIENRGEKLLQRRKLFISNIGNLYFYNEEKSSFFYSNAKTITKNIYYKIKDGYALCSLKHFIVFAEKKSIIAPNLFIGCTIKIPVNDMDFIQKNLSLGLFFEKDAIAENHEDISPESSANIILSGEHLVKEYGDYKDKFTALNDVTVKIETGDFVCIMGPSGSGKSTLINNLSTIDTPTSGAVKFKGKNLLSMGEKEMSNFRYKNLGFIFQDFNLVNTLTVKENIALPLILAAVPRKEIEERTSEIAETLNITEILKKYPSQCSGGQRQRVSCARALVTNPQIIVADEPTGNLDTKNSHEFLKMLQNLNEKNGTTILMVTHDNMIASYSKKLIFIRDGKVAEILEKDSSTQKEFFYKIVDVTSGESQNLLDIL
ncbi:Bacitracin export ATP-binding protein BceA [Clostridium vincentii]|uniref:Bacitracin export ATP-binding protein BceA n=1 Tax=Clostridium vincentii TaxID=52704 RepID=A0A2T0BE46_9CLOT|nr:Bacitracin export ATP-binding protein BceA [Clostridium vincentii]